MMQRPVPRDLVWNKVVFLFGNCIVVGLSMPENGAILRLLYGKSFWEK